MTLTSKQRQQLKALAHHLKPLLRIGKEGFTPALAAELDAILERHELVKVKLNQNTFEDGPSAALAIQQRLQGVEHVWTIGHTLLLFRPSSKEEHRRIQV